MLYDCYAVQCNYVEFHQYWGGQFVKLSFLYCCSLIFGEKHFFLLPAQPFQIQAGEILQGSILNQADVVQ